MQFRSILILAAIFAISVTALSDGPPSLVWRRAGVERPDAARLSSSRQLLATAGFNQSAKFWDLADGRFLGAFRDGSFRTGVAVNGDAFASIHVEDPNAPVPEIDVWRILDGELTRRIPIAQQQSLTGCAFVPNSPLLIALGSVDYAYLLDTNTGDVVRSFLFGRPNPDIFSYIADHLAVWPDGSRCLIVANMGSWVSDGTARLSVFDTMNGQRLWFRSDWATTWGPVAISPNGTCVGAARYWDREIELRSAADGSLVRTLSRPDLQSAAEIRFSQDGALLFARHAFPSVVSVWRVDDGIAMPDIILPSDTVGMLAHPDGVHLIIVTQSHGVLTLRIADGTAGPVIVEPFAALAAEFMPEGSRIAALIRGAGGRTSLKVFRANDGSILWQHAETSRSNFDISPDGTKMSIIYGEGQRDGTLYMLRASDGTSLWQRGESSHTKVDISPDGGFIVASGTASGDAAELVDAQTSEFIRSYRDSSGFVLSFSADGQWLAGIDGGGNSVVIWQAFGDSRFVIPMASIRGIVPLPPAQFLILGSTGFGIWDGSIQTLVRQFGGAGDAGPLALSRDREFLAAGHFDDDSGERSIRLWNLDEGTVLRSIPIEPGALLADLEFSAHAATLVATLHNWNDRPLRPTIRYYSTATGAELRRYDRQVGSYGATLRTSPDSHALLTIDGDGTLTMMLDPCSKRHGDLTGDCNTSLADLALLLSSFGTCDGDPAFDSVADVNDSGCIDVADLGVVLASFGR